MSFAEDTTRLDRSFRTTTSLLRRMLQGLQARRVAWGSARPSLVAPSPELEQLAQELAAEEAVRTQLLADIGRVMPAPANGSARALHLNVTRIAGALSAEAGRSLRQAADEATAAAKAVRIEVTMGQRLLKFTQQVQEGLLGRLTGTAGGPGPANSYDRNARSRRGLGIGAAAGHLVDGRI